MRFPGNDLWDVVTGGGLRIRTSNTYTNIYTPLTIVNNPLNINADNKIILDSDGDQFAYIVCDDTDTLGYGSGSSVYASANGEHYFTNGDGNTQEGVYANSFWMLNRLTCQNDSSLYLDFEDAGDGLRVEGDIVAYYSSDKRLKDNIELIKNPIDKVKQLSGYTFEWNEESHKETGARDIGVIAQEVESVLPELVQTRSNGYKAVDYQKLTALLIEVVKEQQAQIDEIKKQINS
jgi:hypothetical protein